MRTEDEAIMCELIGQVAQAVPKRSGASETSVRTLISRPMWRAWCRAVGAPEDSKPTDWLGIQGTLRVYGSETIVVESDLMFAVSFAPPIGEPEPERP